MSELKTLFIGKVKDKASIVKTKFLHTFTSKPIKNIHLALLKSTTHTSHKPPNSNYVSDIISYSNSRYDPTAFAAVMWRLRGTNNAFVANKSLIVLHKLIRSSRDKFDGLDDQSWNNLKLKEFWDKSSSLAQELSQWVRWYGLYLDHLSWIWKLLGSFPNLLKSSKDKTQETERVLSYQTEYIMRQLDFLVSFFEHICTRPETPVMFENKIVDEIRELVIQDYFTVMILIVVRLQVLSERLIKPGGGDSGLSDLNLVLVRLEECKESLSGFFWRYRRLGEDFWCMVEMLKGEMVKENMEIVEFAGSVKDDDDEMVGLSGLVQTEWVTFEDTETGSDQLVRMDSEWVTFDDQSNGLTNESVWFSRHT